MECGQKKLKLKKENIIFTLFARVALFTYMYMVHAHYCVIFYLKNKKSFFEFYGRARDQIPMLPERLYGEFDDI